MALHSLTPACEGFPVAGTVRVAEGPDAGQPAGLDSHQPVAATCRCGGTIRRETWIAVGAGGDWRHAEARHDARCLYCEHGPYCLTCPPPGSIPDDAHVCDRCREEITRSEIAADPYYQGGAVFGDGA